MVLPAETEIKMASLCATMWFMAQLPLYACEQGVASHENSAQHIPHPGFTGGSLLSAGGRALPGSNPSTLLQAIQLPSA